MQVPTGRFLPSRPDINTTAFEALLSLAGQSIAQDLLAQMRVDLLGNAYSITASLDPLDKEVLCARCHVLCSIAGTAGAESLHHAAAALSHACHGEAPEEEVNRLAIPTLEKLYGLIRHIDLHLLRL